ncbi:MAG: two-component system NtrC family sensor kinase [Gammaproteobacteria bacterium]|jgi:two-component system NtrC family sensor kinase
MFDEYANCDGFDRTIYERVCEVRAQDDLDFILADTEELVAESLDGTKRVSEIVLSLKSFARTDSLTREEANINDCIESVLEMLANQIKYHCEVERNLDEIPPILCNAGELNQVFMNLIMNASQSIESKGVIGISTDTEQLLASISDNGCGIAPENLKNLFVPFFTTKEVGQGTGLGLSISHGIVEKHGGSIEVVSTIGEGTVFTVRLPLEPSADAQAAA